MTCRKINGSYFMVEDKPEPSHFLPYEQRAPITVPELLRLNEDRLELAAAVEAALAERIRTVVGSFLLPSDGKDAVKRDSLCIQLRDALKRAGTK